MHVGKVNHANDETSVSGPHTAELIRHRQVLGLKVTGEILNLIDHFSWVSSHNLLI
jgi:hypothetical protein